MLKQILTFFKNIYSGLINKFVRYYNENTIEYWQRFSFYSICFFLSIFGVAAYLQSLVNAILLKKIFVIIVDTLVTVSSIFIVFYTKIPYRVKIYYASFTFYFLGAAGYYGYGPSGDSGYWLFGFVLLCSLFINFRMSVIASFLNLFTLFALNILYINKLILWTDINNSAGTNIWLIVILNSWFLNIMFAFAINIIMKGISRALEKINRAKIATIIGLAKLAEYKDPATGEHLEHIGAYSVLLASSLSRRNEYNSYITDQYINDLFISSTLHDIGKVGIPDHILLKPEELTQGEFSIIKNHPGMGKNVIAEISRKLGDKTFFKMAEDIALCHHEKWDGSGYPGSLAGNTIPLSARIVAIADVYDALTSDRVYKKAFAHEQAVEIIKSESGKHFDPLLVMVFLEVADKFNNIKKRKMFNGLKDFVNEPMS